MSAGTPTETSTIVTTISTNLENATTAGRRIYYGTRLQTSALPALTYEVTAVEAATIGTAPESTFAVSFNAVAETPDAALALAESLYGALVLELTWKVVEAGRATLAEPTAEAGDEAGLYIATTAFTLYA